MSGRELISFIYVYIYFCWDIKMYIYMSELAILYMVFNIFLHM